MALPKQRLSLHSQTVQAVSEEYCVRRKQFKKAKLRWRTSRGAHRSLGWIPVKAVALNYKNGQVHYQGQPISLWDSYGLKDYALRSGSFCEDARGRWYLNVTVDVKKPEASPGKASVGIDLGLKDFAALSSGETIEAQKIYRGAEQALAVAQRAKNKKRVTAIHAQIANRRKDFLHKLSTRMVKEHGAVFVGNVNASALAKTTMAKSVLDAGWSAFRSMLKYKCDYAAVWFEEVNECYSTQECSSCHAMPGRAPRVLQDWRCGSGRAAFAPHRTSGTPTRPGTSWPEGWHRWRSRKQPLQGRREPMKLQGIRRWRQAPLLGSGMTLW